MISIPQQNARPRFSMLDMVRMISILTVINLIFTILSFLDVSGGDTNYDTDRPLELGRYRDEKLAADVQTGAPLIILKSEEVFERPGQQSQDLKEQLKSTKSGIFISVRTTNRFHRNRLKLLLDTWISEIPENTWIITDNEDSWLNDYIKNHYKSTRPQVLYTECPTSLEDKWGLLCKLHWEYRTFLSSNKSWFCHFDDDSFVNINMLSKLLSLYSQDDDVYIGRTPSQTPITAMAYDTENVEPESFSFNETTNETMWVMPEASFQRVAFYYALGGAGFCISRQLATDMKAYALGSRLMHMAASIALPDDCVFGYIITYQLNVSLVTTNLMRTHMENLTLIPPLSLHRQVSLSYSLPRDNQHMEDSKYKIIPENAENSVFFLRNSSNKNFIVPNVTKPNVVSMDRFYSAEDDPTRFFNLHHLVYSKDTV